MTRDDKDKLSEAAPETTPKPIAETALTSDKRPPHGLIRAFRYALEGFSHTIRTQRNMRIHLVITALVVIVGILIRLNRLEWALISICIGLVMASELINTALEAVVDIASPAFHPKAKIAKDAAAAAVFVFSLVAVIVGLLVFFSAADRLAG